jgi:hypothetical protein
MGAANNSYSFFSQKGTFTPFFYPKVCCPSNRSKPVQWANGLTLHLCVVIKVDVDFASLLSSRYGRTFSSVCSSNQHRLLSLFILLQDEQCSFHLRCLLAIHILLWPNFGCQSILHLQPNGALVLFQMHQEPIPETDPLAPSVR